MFVDEVVIKIVAGKGGDGCTSFRREKCIPLGGPNGGNGGRGADIIFEVDKGLRTLVDLKYRKQIIGDKGVNGKGSNRHGANAEPIIVKVPEGTTLIDDEILDSFSILSLVSEIEDAFDIEVEPVELVAENFNSAEALWNMILRLRGEA